jgi:hypothetical protein
MDGSGVVLDIGHGGVMGNCIGRPWLPSKPGRMLPCHRSKGIWESHLRSFPRSNAKSVELPRRIDKPLLIFFGAAFFGGISCACNSCIVASDDHDANCTRQAW